MCVEARIVAPTCDHDRIALPRAPLKIVNGSGSPLRVLAIV
jgi:kynurenine formamidase